MMQRPEPACVTRGQPASPRKTQTVLLFTHVQGAVIVRAFAAVQAMTRHYCSRTKSGTLSSNCWPSEGQTPQLCADVHNLRPGSLGAPELLTHRSWFPSGSDQPDPPLEAQAAPTGPDFLLLPSWDPHPEGPSPGHVTRSGVPPPCLPSTNVSAQGPSVPRGVQPQPSGCTLLNARPRAVELGLTRARAGGPGAWVRSAGACAGGPGVLVRWAWHWPQCSLPSVPLPDGAQHSSPGSWTSGTCARQALLPSCGHQQHCMHAANQRCSQTWGYRPGGRRHRPGGRSYRPGGSGHRPGGRGHRPGAGGIDQGAAGIDRGQGA